MTEWFLITFTKNRTLGFPRGHQTSRKRRIHQNSSISTFALTLRIGEYIREILQQIPAGTPDLDHFKTLPDTKISHQ
jgi:hypothetical protein